tara:strand:- start:311 stop:664 length:354 start_codon:yes stop_codon:yes gene_type:complete
LVHSHGAGADLFSIPDSDFHVPASAKACSRFAIAGTSHIPPRTSLEQKALDDGSKEREHVSTAVNYFWGEGSTSSEFVNQGSVAIAYEAPYGAQACSAAIVFVPRLASGRAGTGHVV